MREVVIQFSVSPPPPSEMMPQETEHVEEVFQSFLEYLSSIAVDVRLTSYGGKRFDNSESAGVEPAEIFQPTQMQVAENGQWFEVTFDVDESVLEKAPRAIWA